MKKQLLIFLITILSYNCYSQINFEKGYFINEDNQKTTCFIKNLDWKNNPSEFEYKISETSQPLITNITTVKEFSIDNISKYVRASINIDRSSENVNELSDKINPVFKVEVLFLKVLIEGKSSLYEYVEGHLQRFFYKPENSNIEQLVYKSYSVDNASIAKNYQFRQQLWTNLQCPTFTIGKFENLQYSKNRLLKIFTEYNKCHNSEIENFEIKTNKDLFNLTIRPRITNSSLTINNFYTNSQDTNFGSKIGFGLGLEAEYILPYNKNKWAIFIEPTYQRFQSEKINETKSIIGGQAIINVDYKYIEIPIGLRHYFFLNNSSKIFINASYVFDYNLKSAIEVTRNDSSLYNSLEVSTGQSLAFGIGFKQNKKYSFELRYRTSKEVLANYLYWKSEYNNLALIFGYTLF